MPGHLLEILIHVGRIEAVILAIAVTVLKQLLSGKVLATLDDSCQTAILDPHRVILAPVAAKSDEDVRSVNLHMIIAKRGDAKGSIVTRVRLVTDTHQYFVEEANNRGDISTASKLG